MKKELAALAVTALAAGCSATQEAADTAKSKTTAAASAAKTTAAEAGAPSPAFPKTDGDWQLTSLRVKNSLGSFLGTARIRYTGSDTRGGANVFTVSVYKGSREIGTLQGGTSEVKPGQAKTVTLISGDPYVAGPYRYTFQKDL